jgi:hypothetical protein
VRTAPDVDDAVKVAAHAAALCQQLSKHVARLVGDLGMRALFERSLYLAGASFAALRGTAIGQVEGPYEALRVCLERESPEQGLAAAAHVLTTFIGLLERFIGEGLVAQLLNEVWPAAFPTVVKEKT